MAIVLSQLIGNASGSIGGITIYNGKGGILNIRSRRRPTDPSTSQQTVVRSAFATLVNRWVDVLDDGQRAAWDLYGANVPVQNSLGLNINLSGQNWYIAANAVRLQSTNPIYSPLAVLPTSAPVIDDAPSTFDRGTFTVPDLVALNQGFGQGGYNITPGDAWANEDGAFMFIFLSRPRNSSRLNGDVPFRLAGAIAGDSGSPPGVAHLINETFPNFSYVAGQFGRIRAIVSRADGRISASFDSNDVVAT